MEVKDFVASTLQQIMEGVAAAQPAARALGGYVNPTPFRVQGDTVTATDHPIHTIDFDIALTVVSEGSTEAGAKVQIASIVSIGGKGRAVDKAETTSRVKFAVHVTLPVDEASATERANRKAEEKAARERRNREEDARVRDANSGSWMG